MKSRTQQNNWIEKPSAGWWNGIHSGRIGWLIPDTQYIWGVNTVNRGGIIQTRPGYKLLLTAPAGNFQGFKIFKSNKTETTITYIVFAVDGKVYASPYPFSHQSNWEPYRLKHISFSPTVRKIYFEVADKSVTSATEGTLQIVPTYSILMMQDGIAQAAYFDGVTNAHTDENAPTSGTPRGTWMIFSGSRLWIARGNIMIACDLLDPLSAKERITLGGDFRFNDVITGLGATVSDNRKSNVVVFTVSRTETLLSSLLDREKWADQDDFQTILYPDLGCESGDSIFNHQGLLWWYSYGGLVSSDSSVAAFLSSRIKYRDSEMAFSKRNFAPDLSGIASHAFENYVLVSAPSGDTLNAHTMVLDYSVANTLNSESDPAWQGIWTGIRPIKWDSDNINGQRRIFAASVDYQELNGSFNHIWEAFQSDRRDVFDSYDSNGNVTTIKNRIYCSMVGKLLGDGMDYKRFKFAEVDLCEISGEVDFKVSFGGSKGGYHEISRSKIIATTDADGQTNERLIEIVNSGVVLRNQSRRIITQNSLSDSSVANTVEGNIPDTIDKYFGLYIQWCGVCGIESYRMFMEYVTEKSQGACTKDETGVNILTEDGKSFKLT